LADREQFVAEPSYSDSILSGIQEALDTPMPDDLQPTIDKFKIDHKSQMDHLVASLMAVMVFWLKEAALRVDERAAIQLSMHAFHTAGALYLAQVKARHSEQLLPGRYALAAYHFAHTASLMDVTPANLSVADDLLNELRTPIERERDALRLALHDIHVMALDACGTEAPGLSNDILERIAKIRASMDETQIN
jgi:hypothetical protein